MRLSAASLIALMIVSFSAHAQEPDSSAQKQPPEAKGPSKVFYGGTLGLSFGDYFRISIQPMVGYALTEQVSGGVKVCYEYVSDSRYTPTVTSSNYGGSVFGRFRFIPQAYAHAEFAYMSYEYRVSGTQSERFWVPFVLLGGGYIQQISPSTSLFVEVLFDVVQDSKSPYAKGAPWVSAGVMVGI